MDVKDKTLTNTESQAAAKAFVEYWQDKGDEKQETARFWIELLQKVLGIDNPAQFIEFEKKVQLTHTSFIDAYIPSTKVLIEQKGSKIDLHKGYEQSDGSILTPYQQAKRYADEMPNSIRPDWIIVCNFTEFLIYNMENPHAEPVQILLKNLPKDMYLLSFVTSHKTEALQRELEISIEAGKIVGELYDELLKQYKKKDEVELKSLNILCVRLVFCLYAEDSGIFGKKQIFKEFLQSFNAENVRTALIELFKVLDTPSEEEKSRLKLPKEIETRDPYLDEKFAQFPYVNGGLFKDEKIVIPPFNDTVRDFLLNKASVFDWSEISPTIFGAVFESTLNPETRRSGGMHYTSIENIHKVIDPLFLDDLNAEFEKITTIKTEKSRKQNLEAFQKKLGSLTFLDPACGSGNFLTETYLSLRRLENKVISLLNKGVIAMGFDDVIQVHINQFYGIEINDFAVTVAKTALWIAESQMLAETEEIVSQTIEFLPLTTNASIVEGNALRMDWATLRTENRFNAIYTEKLNVYKVDENFGNLEVHTPLSLANGMYEELNIIAKEVEEKTLPKKDKQVPIEYDYIIGNPPFVGYAYQIPRQKEDLSLVDGIENKNIDYVAGWYFKAASLIHGKKTKVAFVSTNSITQGEQVAEVWKPIFKNYGIKIDFAYQTFKWYSESYSMAHVHCVIIGFSDFNTAVKESFLIDSGGVKKIAKNINPYLLDAPTVFVEKRKQPLCNVSKINKGSQPTDGGNLIISAAEYEDFIAREPGAMKFIREFLGAEEFINGKKRYCLWLVNASPAELRKMPLVTKRIAAVKEMRESSSKTATRNWAAYPYLFTENRQPENGNYLLIPRVSSEKRRYIPIGYISSDVIASDAVQLVPNATLYEFGVLTSNVHNAWMRSVCGRLESRYRYSNDIVYNNFPWPAPTDEQKAKIEETAQAILNARAKYPDSSLADLYDDTLMPSDLRKAHQANDKAVMQLYGFSLKITESECVAELFNLYEKLVKNL